MLTILQASDFGLDSAAGSSADLAWGHSCASTQGHNWGSLAYDGLTYMSGGWVHWTMCLQLASRMMAEFQDCKPQCVASPKPFLESRLLMSHYQRMSHGQAQSQGCQGLSGEWKLEKIIHRKPLLNNLPQGLIHYYPCFTGEEIGSEREQNML